MKVNVMTIPEDGMKLQISKDGGWFHNLLPEKEKIDFPLQGVAVFLSIERLRDTISIAGNIETIADIECCRCLELNSHTLKNEFRYTLVPSAGKEKEELELSLEELEFGYYKDDTVNIDQIILEQIILQIPINALCKDSCKGLCAHCGINLNMARCNCQIDFVDERLAVLKNVKF